MQLSNEYEIWRLPQSMESLTPKRPNTFFFSMHQQSTTNLQCINCTSFLTMVAQLHLCKLTILTKDSLHWRKKCPYDCVWSRTFFLISHFCQTILWYHQLLCLIQQPNPFARNYRHCLFNGIPIIKPSIERKYFKKLTEAQFQSW